MPNVSRRSGRAIAPPPLDGAELAQALMTSSSSSSSSSVVFSAYDGLAVLSTSVVLLVVVGGAGLARGMSAPPKLVRPR